MKKVFYIVLVLFFIFFVSTLEVNAFDTVSINSQVKVPDPNFTQLKDCASLLGPNLTKVVKACVKIIQILGAIIAIVMGMIKLIPAIMSKDADGLQAASKKLVLMAIILLIIFLLPSIIKMIGSIFKFDTTCFF